MPLKKTTNEAHWVKALKQGEEAAFTHFFDLYHKSLCFFALRLLQNDAEGQEIVSDCFVKLWERRNNFETGTAIKAFLFISCRNACFNWLKRQKNISTKQSEYLLQLEKGEETILFELVETEILDMVNQEIEKLPDKCREVFNLIYLHQHKTSQVAIELGISVQTVRNHKTRAIQLLKTAFLKKGVSAALTLAFLLFIAE